MVFGSSQQLEVAINGDASGLTSAAESATSSLVSVENAAIGAGAAVAGAGAAAFTKAAGSAASFDEAMQESKAVMGDLSSSMEDDLEQTARDVAKSTTHSHEEAAESFYYLASAGLEATDSMEAMPEVAAFAEAGNMDMAKATDYATDTMQAFGMEAGDLNDVTDALTGTVTDHNQTMEGMGQAMSYVAPVASGMGMELEETASAIGMLGDAGIKGSKAGTTLRQALGRLSDPPEEVKQKLDEMGVSVRDSEGDLKSMSAIIGEFEKAGADAEDMMQIFGKRAGPGMQVLLQQGSDALANETEQLKEMDGVTQDVAETQKQTFNKQLQIFKSRVNDAAISIGQQLLPHLSVLLKHLASGVEAFAAFNDRMNGLPGIATLAGTTITGLVLAIGGLAAKFGLVTGVLSGFTVALGAILAPLAAGAAAVRVFTRNIGGARDMAQRVAGVLQDELGATFLTLRGLITTVAADISSVWGDSTSSIRSAVERVVSVVGDKLVGAIRTVGRSTRYVITQATMWWQAHAETVLRKASQIGQFLVGYLVSKFHTFRSAASAVLSALGSLWQRHSGLVTAAIDRVRGVIARLRERFTSLDDSSQTVVASMGRVSASMLGVLGPVGAAIAAATALATAWEENLFSIRDTVTGVMNFVVNQFLKPLLSDLVAVWRTHFGQMRNETGSTLGTIRAIVLRALGGIAAIWKRYQEEILAVARFLSDTLRATFVTFFDGLLTLVRVSMAVLQGDWEAAWTGLKNFGERTLNRFLAVVASFKNNLVPIFSNLFTTVRENWRTWLVNLFTFSRDKFALFLEWVRNWKLWPALQSTLITVRENWDQWLVNMLNYGIARFNEFYNWVSDWNLWPALADMLSTVRANWDTWAGNIYDDITGIIQDANDWFWSTGKGLMSSAWNAMANAAASAWNGVIPGEVNIPELSIGGGSVGVGPLKAAGQTIVEKQSMDIPEVTVGGQSMSLPQLDTGGLIERSGMAWVDEGEWFSGVPTAGVDRNGGPPAGAGGTTVHADIDVYAEDGDDAGDQIRRELESVNLSR
jgi:TP901 family phage tail tape measure protein